MIAIVSIIGIPIGFILFSGLATALLQLIGGTAVQNYIAVANVSSIITTMNNGLTELAKSFNLDINIKDVAGGTIAMKMDTTINLLIEAFKKLSEEAGKQALTTIQEKINLIIENLSQMKVSFANVMENVAKLNMEINSYLSNPAH
ncbi:MAG: hypothetical protein MJ223_02830 [Mycoplasmoidaceae bacterium]|nr:hypothetical protein [Mycoplasmoidaceae bacterium]